MRDFKNNLNHPLINKINNKLETCNICENSNTKGGNFFNNFENNNIDIIYIAQNPGQSNYNKDLKPKEIIPFGLNNKNNNYHQFFDILHTKIEDEILNRKLYFYITNLIKCSTENNKIEDENMINVCIKEYLYKELKFFNKHNSKLFIVLLGSYVTKKFNMNFLETKITKKNNYILSMYHPGYMNRKGIKIIENDFVPFVYKFFEKFINNK